MKNIILYTYLNQAKDIHLNIHWGLNFLVKHIECNDATFKKINKAVWRKINDYEIVDDVMIIALIHYHKQTQPKWDVYVLAKINLIITCYILITWWRFCSSYLQNTTSHKPDFTKMPWYLLLKLILKHFFNLRIYYVIIFTLFSRKLYWNYIYK